METKPHAGPRIQQDGFACWVIPMRGEQGYFCLVRVGYTSAQTEQQARVAAMLMFPELTLDTSGVEPHKLVR